MKHSSRSIAEAGHRGDKHLIEAVLASGNPSQKRLALGAALRLDFLDHGLLNRALRDPSATVRARAAELAPRVAARWPGDGAGAHAETARALTDLLDDPACAEIAAFALGELEWADETTVSRLEYQARHHDDPLCRESAVAALGAIGAGQATVLAALDDIATVRRRAVIALANFEGSEVDAALQRATTDRDWQVRQAAEDLLTTDDLTPGGGENEAEDPDDVS